MGEIKDDADEVFRDYVIDGDDGSGEHEPEKAGVRAVFALIDALIGDAGVRFTFDSSTTTSADPGAGDIRLNHATPASVTEVGISDKSAATGNPDVSGYLATFDDGTSTIKGHLVVRKVGAPQTYAIYAVTAATDAATHWRFTVTHVASAGTFSAGASLSALFVPKGDKGEAGDIGVDGLAAGVRWKFDVSTTTADDPGAGDLRLNNATLASVTEVALSDSAGTIGNPDVAAWLATFDDSTAAVKGHFIITKASAPENFAIYAVTAAIDAATHWRFTVSHGASAGSFSAEDNLAVQFVPKGDVGAGSTVAVAQDGSSVSGSVETLNFSSAFAVADDGAGQVTVDRAFSGVLLTKSANQTANFTSQAAVPWNTEAYDDGGWFDSATSTTKIIVPAGVSKIEIKAGLYIQGIGAGVWVQMQLHKNGSANFAGSPMLQLDAAQSTQWGCGIATPALNVAEGDEFELMLINNTDTSISLIAARGSYFAAEKVA